jgi:hypothetical protein
MKHADIGELGTRVSNVIQNSLFGDRISKVSVEAGNDDEGSEFLRVFLHFKTTPNLRWQNFQIVVRAIEDELAAIDERFPSVRIAEAA